MYSPTRRVIQALALVAFFVLFLYVCWPYTAQPAQRTAGWLPIAVDGQTGQVVMTRNEAPSSGLKPETIVHISEAADGKERYLGAFRVVGGNYEKLELAPVSVLSEAQREVLTASFGPWSLSDRNPEQWPSHYADDLQRKELIDAELFLMIDPLVSFSTAVAARQWIFSLAAAAVILVVCLVIPRGFCGYLCPLGTVIDLFDWAVSRRIERFRIRGSGWWVHLKYYMLIAVLTAAAGGVLLSGYVAAIPVITRAAAFCLTPLETGLARDWHQLPAWGWGQVLSVVLFVVVLGLGLLQPRFWCRYVCPSGAMFSLANLFRVSERQVESTCIHCGKCIEVCPFDAIKADFTTRTTDCTFCQTCGGVCPVESIRFVPRGTSHDLKVANDPPTGEGRMGRRGFLATIAGIGGGLLAGIAGATATRAGADRSSSSTLPVRPPGSVPEKEFLAMCIRCGECFQACPNDVLQPLGIERGLDNLWTPHVVADWAGCEPSCSNCGQVCPTGAIRALPLEEKRAARMGLAIVNEQTCLPFAGREACQLCVDECVAAGYDAITFIRHGTELDTFGEPIEGTGYLAPVVSADLCVGCGLCQTRCYKINVESKGLLAASAIIVRAGEGREDRILDGSYQKLQRRRMEAKQTIHELPDASSDYLPDFLTPKDDEASPFE